MYPVTYGVSSRYGLQIGGHTIPSCSASNQSIGFCSAVSKMKTHQKPHQLFLTKQFLPAFLCTLPNNGSLFLPQLHYLRSRISLTQQPCQNLPFYCMYLHHNIIKPFLLKFTLALLTMCCML